jgi:putative acetyltransferase
VFLRAIRETAAGDYSPDQVAARATEHGDLAAWPASRAAAHTQLAIIDGRVAGFTHLDDDGYDDDGYEDMLFMDPDLDRQTVATSMLLLARAPVGSRHRSDTRRFSPFRRRGSQRSEDTRRPGEPGA